MNAARTPACAIVALALALAIGTGAGAQPPVTGGDPRAVGAREAAPLWPGSDLDPAIPSLADVLGHEPGERIVAPADAERYLEALAAAAPDRLRLVEYGRTWEGRSLVYAVVASARNLARLEAVKAGMSRLADPRRTDAAAAEALIADLPAVVWLGYGIHGDEISSTDAALQVAYHLLAARGDELVEAVLASAVAVIDPSQNPDGRDRFVRYNAGAVGLEPSAHPAAAEHDQPWPGGRTNHYHFDLNRDLILLTQPESRARVRAALEWHPLVFVDAHEMGAESTFFFPPNAEPANPYVTASQQAALELFGRNNARWFDRFGFPYFTREVFDFFYPGYIDTWAVLQGSIGMTYEQASARGLVVERRDGSLLTYRDGVRQHFVASLATLETAARNRERLLRDFWEYRRSAVEEGRSGDVRELLLPWSGDTSLVADLATLLVEQGIEVGRTTREIDACGRKLPAGSFRVSTAQPTGRFARTLLEPGAEMAAPFVREQERRRRKGLPHEIYDVTAWSLPLLYGVEAVPCGEAVSASAVEPFAPVGDARPVAPLPAASGVAGGAAPSGGEVATAPVAYLVPWSSAAAARFLVAALEADLEVVGADAGFTLGGRAYPRGTLVVRDSAGDPAAFAAAVATVAEASGAEVVATGTSWVESGIGLGSDRAVRLRLPEVALLWDEPTSATAAGALRWVLERRLGVAVTVVRSASLADAELDDFEVVLLPDGTGYGRVLGERGKQRLVGFVEQGGVLIAIAGGASYLADPEVDLLAIRSEIRARAVAKQEGQEGGAGETAQRAGASSPGATGGGGGADVAAPAAGAESGGDEGRVPGTVIATEADYLAAIAAEKPAPDVVPGAVVRAVPDPDHWLTVGVAPAVAVMVEGSSIFSPLRLDQGTNALHFAAADQLVASGYLWSENRAQLAWKPFAVVQERGRGLVIGFTADPAFRGVFPGLDLLLANAVLRAPAHTRR